MSKNRLPAAPNPVGGRKKPQPRLGTSAVWNKTTMFYETDLNLPGIDPTTNNYPIVRTPIYYYTPEDYYDNEGGFGYYETQYI